MALQRVYMDHNATSPLLPKARDAMLASFDYVGNPSSVHKEGRDAKRLISDARDAVAKICGAEPQHITFTSGATEAANHILTPHFKMGRSDIKVSKLYMCETEHPCILTGGQFTKDNIVMIGVDQNGCIDLDDLRQKIQAHDSGQGLPMLALQYANNETGIIQPVKEAIAIAKDHNAITIIDAVQVIGRIQVLIEDIGADFMIISGHKIGGPKGIGALVSRGEILMPKPLLNGGGQEKGHRCGTENLSAIAGFGAAASENLAFLEQINELTAKRDAIEAHLSAFAPDIVIHGRDVARIGNTLCFSLPELKSETGQIAFDMEGVALSSGAACSSGKVGESHVLKAMGVDANLGALRISIGHTSSHDEIEFLIKAFEKINQRRLTKTSNAAE